MTTPAHDRAVEEAFEAALAGRPVPAGAQVLTAFTDALRTEATVPGRPNAALAELLATGLLTDPSRTTVGRSAPASRKRRPMILTTLVAKFAAAGAVAKASVAGGAVAALALTGAATDVLPLPGDDVVTAGDASDETTADDPADDSTTGGTDVLQTPEDGVDETPGDLVDDDTDDAMDSGTGDEAGEVPPLDGEPVYEVWITGPQGQSFGEWVSQGANRGWSNGQIVSCFAHARNAGRAGTECIPATTPAPADDDAATVEESDVIAPDVAEEEAAPAPEPAPAAPSHGNGGGNSGNGGNGNGNGNRGR